MDGLLWRISQTDRTEESATERKRQCIRREELTRSWRRRAFGWPSQRVEAVKSRYSGRVGLEVVVSLGSSRVSNDDSRQFHRRPLSRIPEVHFEYCRFCLVDDLLVGDMDADECSKETLTLISHLEVAKTLVQNAQWYQRISTRQVQVRVVDVDESSP